jgi:hypothetical protein
METEIRQIIADLNIIKSELSAIKKNMPDKEMFLTSEESKLLEESRQNKGKFVSSKDLRKSLRI